MYRLSSIILLLGLTVRLFSQSPHGANFRVNCSDCHTSASWDIPFDAWDRTGPVFSKTTGWQIGWDTAQFSHTKTNFPLAGQHVWVDCRSCHESLVFSEAKTDCNSCHTDMHNGTVGSDCARCHTTANWLVDNILELHQDNGFPLLGAHAAAACADCHTSETALQFNRIGNECINCHQADFAATSNPNHKDAGFSTQCSDCHDITHSDWTTDKVKHDFFPLTLGHDIADCAKCHSGGSYANTSSDCISCHKTDYETTLNPNHTSSGFSQNCTDCHTTDPDWMPAQYLQHDADYFPIYSGAHKGEWDACKDCHPNPASYAEYTCTSCHTNPETDNHHNGVNGYTYNNPACLACHPTGNTDDVFDHSKTHFPLTGAHLSADCIDCHSAGYTGTPTECAACHTPDYSQSTNPNHSDLAIPTDCASCHTTDGWSPATFGIHDNYYPLNGAHTAISNDCAACHKGDYNNTPNTCAGCHIGDYNQTTDPNHVAQQFSTDCATCHSETAWAPSTFDHNSFYPLTGAHAAIANDCDACHHGDYTNTPNTCAGCHTPDYNQSANPNHVALAIPTDCATCHTPDGWAPATFAIHDNYYQLKGAHAAIATDCAACHNGDYTNTPNTCAGCHIGDYNQTTAPNHVAQKFSTDCTSCHSETAWIPSVFEHSIFYPLTGAHAAIAGNCDACHHGDYTNTPNTCAGCHTPDYNQSANPNHVALAIPTDCATCHTPDGWSPATFAIHDTYYPLNGAHAGISNDCAACHKGDYNNTPNTCAGCHIGDYNQTTLPNHAAAQFPTDCASCHNETTWVPSSFDHNSFYPLNGAHANIANDCNACHNGDYTNTPNTCAGCHITDYNQTSNPNHTAAQFPTDCASCHSETAWTPATFDHDGQYFPIYSGAHQGEWDQCIDCHTNPNNFAEFTCTTCHTNPETDNQHSGVNGYSYNSPACLACHPTGDANNIFDHNTTSFPLTGAHLTADCIECHAGGYAGTPTDCAACHTPDYNQSANPNHVTLAIPMDCASCHTTDGWSPATFAIHDNYYPLTGAHAAIANECATCHNGDYNNTPNTCAGCHTPDYNQSSNPNHVALAIPTDCATCHTPDGWSPATFAIHDNYYPLNGAHAAISNDCATCHNGDYNNTPNTCAGCHINDYNQTTDPNHASQQFPTDCATCHSESAWVPSTFDHNGFYPLTGAHAAIASDCNACHHGDYTNTPNTCAGCHTPDYNQSSNPNHTAIGIPTDCESCHTPDGWSPALFPIHNNYYPLNGAHAAISNDCAACHNGDYTNTPNTCAGCHIADYNQTTDPDHAAQQFPTDCATCHSETAWTPSTFDHNSFYPLNGAHAAIATDCNACHNGNYANTPNTCAGCHINDYNQTTDPNHATQQFPTDCATCHSESAWIPSTFDHNSFYPLTGQHAAIATDCNACHHGNYTNTPNTCAGCHTPDYNQSTNPNHTAIGIPTDCETCHTPDGWSPAEFPIHNNYYPLNGAHALIANDCAACHNGDYNNTPNTCSGCHIADYNQTTDPNHAAQQFPTDCATCHTETAWIPSTFDHNSFYPLTGQHAAIANDCNVCHNGNYTNTPNTCAGCHTPDYNQSTNPNHLSLGIPADCETCHTPDGWSPAEFPIHNNYYPLNGAHALIANDCAACHNGDYNNTPNTCAGCHIADYNATTDPDHATQQFPTDCATCHTETAWIPSTFDHNNFYPLTGQHATIANDCNACHNGNYTNTPNACAGCHTPDYNQSTNPNHLTLGIPTDCAMCHTPDGWSPAEFPIHNNYYPLNGAHATISNDCAACHHGDYNNTPNTCAGCHMPDYTQTSDPSHVTQQFPTDCTVCHGETTWIPSTLDHNSFYPLLGQHATIGNDCNACHNGNYTNTPNTCAGCHTPDYNQTTNPNHLTLGIPSDCAMCHTPDSWSPAEFPIHNNYYQLNGAHALIANDCAACHNGDYNNTPNTCVGCHIGDYNQTTDPNHSVQQLPTDCASCHSETAWIPSTFDHNSFYPLNGAHAAIANDCNACHNGNYINTPNTCAGCHMADYNQANNPNHVSAGFPTTCQNCHSENAWTPSTWDHDGMYFPIYSGKHKDEWDQCSDCHNVPGDYSIFNCLGCHTNPQTNNQHQGVSGYSYSSPACYSCHPDGSD